MERTNGCTLCPRACHADRAGGQPGYCGMDDTVRLARAALHAWEEPCISGERGSGTVFFSGCPLRCVYCQNHEIACGTLGRSVTIEELARCFLALQDQGAHNLNLVTPTHYVPQICAALDLARADGLRLPVVYNTGSYETVDTIKRMAGYAQIYLPDLKYMDTDTAKAYSNAPDYFPRACAAIAQMVRQAGDPVFDEETGLMQRGVIVRHLILPGHVAESKRIVRYLHETYGDHIYMSLMNQYTPLAQVAAFPELCRTLTAAEYDEVVDYAIEIGVENGFIQEEGTAKESFIPAFGSEIAGLDSAPSEV